MSFKVILTSDAAYDLNELYDYISIQDSPRKADYILNEFEKKILSLSESPERGVYPKELLAMDIREFREIFFKPYRIIYRIIKKKVYVVFIVDGRRDIVSLLSKRLLKY
jgi:toxin ParE1/3/4